jgi:hypothetical protein
MATMKINESFLWAGEADADMRSNLNKFAKLSTDGEVALAGANEKVLGTIVEVNLNASAPFGPVTVQMEGIAKVIAGGTVSIGDEVSSDASGKAVTGGTQKAGTAMTAGVSGDVIEVVLNKGTT